MESKEKRKMDEMLIKEYDDVLKQVHDEWKALPESRKKETLSQIITMMLNVQTKLHVYWQFEQNMEG